MTVRTALVAVLVLLTTVACGGDGPVDAQDDDAEAPSVPSGLEQVVAAARQLVAAETGVAEGELELVEASEVTWPSGALGCPQPGQVYTQALVEGYRIVFRADGETVHVHGGQGGDPFVCHDPEEPVETTS